jgi:hypothetical protein
MPNISVVGCEPHAMAISNYRYGPFTCSVDVLWTPTFPSTSRYTVESDAEYLLLYGALSV